MPLDNPNLVGASFNKCSVPKRISLPSKAPKSILEPNSNRKYAAIFNYSEAIITLTLQDPSNTLIGQGIPLLPFGSYEITQDNLYKGRISAICESDVDLVCFECI